MSSRPSARPRRASVAALGIATALAAVLTASAPALAADEEGTLDRVVLTPPEDPSTSQSITWRTDADVTEGSAFIRPAGGSAAWREVEATLTNGLQPEYVSHSATVDGLTPGTEYEYWVGTEEQGSETYEFTTAGAAGDPFTFIYFGDAQNEIEEKWSPVVDQAYAKYPDAVGTVNAGDLVNVSGNESEWTEWFTAMDEHSQTSNVIAAPGNHEYSGDDFLKTWKATFEYAPNGPQPSGEYGSTAGELQREAYEEQMAEALLETVYYTDYQGVRFISLNASRSQAVDLFTPEDLPPCVVGCPNPTELWLQMQASWLDYILENNPNKWSVAVFHQPVFSTAVGRNEVDVRRAWLPVFQENNIDLVLMGHDHTYARGFVNADATDVPGITMGPVYTVAVAGPKYYDQQPEGLNVWTANGATQVSRAGYTSTFQGITVTDDQLRYESIVAAKWEGEEASTTDVPIGGVLDAFTITKYDDGTKWVTEDGVPIPAEGEEVPGGEQPGGEEPGGEEPQEPVDVPLGYEVTGEIDAELDAPSVSAYDESRDVLLVADTTVDGGGVLSEVDPVTGAVNYRIDLHAAPTDMALGADLRAVLVGFADGTVAAYSIDPWSFGDPLIDPTRLAGTPILGSTFDTQIGIAFVAVGAGPASAVVAVDIEEGDAVGQFVLPANIGRLAIDSATGYLYATFDEATDGATGLRVYSTREQMKLIAEYPLDAHASSVALDMAEGLVYVGHAGTASGTGGMSVLDLSGEAPVTLRYEDDAFGLGVEGVSVDTGSDRVYLSSATSTPASFAVADRWDAPVVTHHPAAATTAVGAEATFSAAATGVPAPTVQWERLAAAGEAWVAIEGEVSESLTVTASAEEAGAKFRAVFTSAMGEESYSATTTGALLTVTGIEEPGGEEPGGEEPGGEEPGGEEPNDPFAAPSEADLTAANRGSVTAPERATVGTAVTVTVGSDSVGDRIGGWLFSTPVSLGTAVVSASGTVSFTIPAATAPGAHRIAIVAEDGTLIGWAPITVVAAAGGTGTAVDQGAKLASTGSDASGWVFAGVLLLGLGAALVAARRRST